MKKVIIACVCIFIIIIMIIISLNYNSTKNYSNEEEQENIINEENNVENIEIQETKKEIQIYDIEEGYLTVPYNENADKHNYNWDKLDISQSKYLYNDELYETKFGIDVSSFQKNVDWNKLKKEGVDFAFIRLGYRGYGEAGKLVIDSMFEKHAKQANENGIDIGIYFFSQAITKEEAIEEAKFVLKNIEDKNITYPICFDLEKIKYDSARTDNLTPEEITEIAIAFCEEIKKAGYTPLIYGNSKTFTTRMKLEMLNDYQKWYADYQTKPLYPYEFLFWQYTEEGKINGIDGNVDFNLQFIPK